METTLFFFLKSKKRLKEKKSSDSKKKSLIQTLFFIPTFPEISDEKTEKTLFFDSFFRFSLQMIRFSVRKIDSEKTYADYFLINRKPRNASRTSDGNSTLPHDASIPRHMTVTYEDPQKEMKNAFYRPPTNMTQPMYQNVAHSHEVSTNGDDVFRPSDLDPRGFIPRSQTRPSQNLRNEYSLIGVLPILTS